MKLQIARINPSVEFVPNLLHMADFFEAVLQIEISQAETLLPARLIKRHAGYDGCYPIFFTTWRGYEVWELVGRFHNGYKFCKQQRPNALGSVVWVTE